MIMTTECAMPACGDRGENCQNVVLGKQAAREGAVGGGMER